MTISYKNNNKFILNNNSKYILDAHAHVVKIKDNENISNLADQSLLGQIYPIQTVSKNITHKLTTNITKSNTSQTSNKSVYLPIDKTIGETYIPQNSILPIGSIIGWCQIYLNNNWVPAVPYGFYQLYNSSYNVLVDCDDQRSIRYNGQLAKLMNENIKITLPGINDGISYNTGKGRIIYILKYSDNWIYTNSRIQQQEKQ